jgi:hypothetical protein
MCCLHACVVHLLSVPLYLIHSTFIRFPSWQTRSERSIDALRDTVFGIMHTDPGFSASDGCRRQCGSLAAERRCSRPGSLCTTTDVAQEIKELHTANALSCSPVPCEPVSEPSNCTPLPNRKNPLEAQTDDSRFPCPPLDLGEMSTEEAEIERSLKAMVVLDEASELDPQEQAVHECIPAQSTNDHKAKLALVLNTNGQAWIEFHRHAGILCLLVRFDAYFRLMYMQSPAPLFFSCLFNCRPPSHVLPVHLSSSFPAFATPP